MIGIQFVHTADPIHAGTGVGVVEPTTRWTTTGEGTLAENHQFPLSIKAILRPAPLHHRRPSDQHAEDREDHEEVAENESSLHGCGK